MLGREWSRRTLPVGSLTREQAAFVDAYNPMGTAVIGPVGTRALGLERSADVVMVRPSDGDAVTDAQRDAFAKAVADPSMDEQLSDENVRVERGFVDQYDRLRWLLVGTVVLLILVATTTATALSMGEAQRDLATLAAIGSTGRLRRWIAAAQAGSLALNGALVGLAVAALLAALVVRTNPTLTRRST